ncbi:MAG TPA: hypothetical protein VMT15_13440 [Bryobacteraceae bacterium]|nr:hypothetical protein [Bryobacteraceae bacterium]
MKSRFILAAAVASILLAGHAQAATNFTGVWKLNLSKSDYGPVPPPEVMTRTINHNEPSLQISTFQKGAQGEVTTELKYTTDGKMVENKGSKGSAKWDGDKLVIDSVRDLQGGEIKFHEIWSLSPDGKTMTINNHLTAPQGEFDITLVFDKQ